MQELYRIIVLTLILSSLTAFIILFGNKTGLRYKVRDFFDKIDVPILSELFDCDFCLSFWLLLFIAILFGVIFGGSPYLLIIPYIGTPITRVLL